MRKIKHIEIGDANDPGVIFDGTPEQFADNFGTMEGDEGEVTFELVEHVACLSGGYDFTVVFEEA